MSRRIILALACGALALGGAFVSGCGSDDDSGDGAAATSAPAPAPAADSGTINVVMQNNRFAPEKIAAKVGQKIHWVNNDGYPHNVVATKGEDFKSDNIDGGGTYDYTVQKAGTIDYVCTIHSGQNGQIRVTQ